MIWTSDGPCESEYERIMRVGWFGRYKVVWLGVVGVGLLWLAVVGMKCLVGH